MERIDGEVAAGSGTSLPDVAEYKRTIGKATLFKTTKKLVRPLFPAFQVNVAAHTVSLVANRLGERIDLEKVWLNRGVSPQLEQQIQT